MAEIDSKRIEEEAVDTVRRAIRAAELLSPYINENEKGPCWDGFIAVHKDNRKTNDGIRRVHVQVKGTTQIIGNTDTIKYDVETIDLEAYREDGGCIYFVVIEKYNGYQLESVQIYYQDLLPFKIYKIQNTIKKHDQKTVRVEFKRFPEKPHDITSIFLQFLANHEAQGAFSAHAVPQAIRIDKRTRPLEIPLIAYSDRPPDPIEALLKADAYFYVRDETGVLFPVDIVNEESEIKQTVPYVVKIGEKEYYQNVLLIRKRNKTKIKIGKSITLEHKENNRVLVHIHFSNFIRQFVKDFGFVYDMLKSKTFTVGGFTTTLEDEEAQQFRKKVIAGIDTYKFYKKVDELMDRLGCSSDSDDSVDIDSSKLKEKDLQTLSLLYRAIVQNKSVGGILVSEGVFTAFKVGDKSFIVQINKTRKKYRLKRIEQSEWKMITKNYDGEGVEVPLIAIYKKEEFIHCMNIEFDKVLETICAVPQNAHLYTFANNVGLRMLSAFDDVHGIRKTQLLNTALQIFDWLNTIDSPEEWDVRISKINHYLTIKMQNSLSETDITGINDLIDDSDDSNMIRFGAYVLLEDNRRAEKYFERMSKEEKSFIRPMPIYTYWKKKA